LEELDVDNEQAASESDQMVEDDAHPREWLLSLMDHVEGQVAFGDTKASLLLTADSILLAAMSAVVTGEHPLIDRLSATSRTLLVLAFLALVIGFLFALYTIIPNRRNLRRTKNGEKKPLLVSFESIAGKKKEDAYVKFALSRTARHLNSLEDQRREKDYVNKALSMTAQDLNDSLARVIHRKSSWALEKFKRLYFATVTTTVGVVTAVLAILVELISTGA